MVGPSTSARATDVVECGVDRLTRAAALDPGVLPERTHELDVLRVLGSGAEVFATAAQRLATWHTHRGLFAVRADGRADELGTTVLLGVGAGPARAWFGCRVVEVLDERGRAGYSYATLAGHPERGVERLTVTLADDGTVMGRVQAWSAPAWTLARLAGPLGHTGQLLVAQRYLRRLG